MSDGSDWTELTMGARMSVDREFRDRVEQSEFSHQQWGLVMTAVEFEIENAGDPDAARLIGDTDNLPAVLPELDRMADATPMAGGAPPDRDGGGDGGLLDSVKEALGFGGGSDSNDEMAAAAEVLVEEYAEHLQAELERTGQWEHVVSVAAAERTAATGDDDDDGNADAGGDGNGDAEG